MPSMYMNYLKCGSPPCHSHRYYIKGSIVLHFCHALKLETRQCCILWSVSLSDLHIFLFLMTNLMHCHIIIAVRWLFNLKGLANNGFFLAKLILAHKSRNACRIGSYSQLIVFSAYWCKLLLSGIEPCQKCKVTKFSLYSTTLTCHTMDG